MKRRILAVAILVILFISVTFTAMYYPLTPLNENKRNTNNTRESVINTTLSSQWAPDETVDVKIYYRRMYFLHAGISKIESYTGTDGITEGRPSTSAVYGYEEPSIYNLIDKTTIEDGQYWWVCSTPDSSSQWGGKELWLWFEIPTTQAGTLYLNFTQHMVTENTEYNYGPFTKTIRLPYDSIDISTNKIYMAIVSEATFQSTTYFKARVWYFVYYPNGTTSIDYTLCASQTTSDDYIQRIGFRGIDALWFDRDPIIQHTTSEYYNNGSAIIHKVTIQNPEYSTRISIHKPNINWFFYKVEPSATVTTNQTHVLLTDTTPTTYTVYFISYDTWHYPEEAISRIAIYNQKGDLLPFDNFKVYRSDVSVYWMDNRFDMTTNPDDETDETGEDGFSENFIDISEWLWQDTVNAFNYNFYSDGNVGVMYVEFSENYPGATYRKYIHFADGNEIDLSRYPFVAFRWKGETNASTYLAFHVSVTNGTYTIYNRWVVSKTSTFDWEVFRINLYEWAKKTWPYLGSWKLKRIGWEINDNPNGVNQYGKIWIDWVHVYGFKNLLYRKSTPTGSNPSAWVLWSDDYGLHFYVPSSAVDDWDWWWSFYYWFDDRININTYRYLVLNTLIDETQYKAVNIRIRIEKLDGTATYMYTGDIYLKNGTTTIDLQNLRDEKGISSDYTFVKEILFAFLASSSDGKDDWLIFSYIGFISDPNEFEPVLYPIYQSYKNSIEWFKIYNVFGDLLIDEPRLFSTYQNFVVSLYSWKIKNQKSDFVHIALQRNGFEFSEWLGPGEIAHYHLYPGQYTLKLTYTDNSYVTYSLDVSGDSYYLISGTTLEDIIYNIQNVNSSLSEQIINVNISLTNWNSQINNTVVNINIRLDNVNSSLGDLILSNKQIILNNNSKIYNQIIVVQNLINNMYSQMNSSFLQVNVDLGILKSNISTLMISEDNHFIILNASIDNLSQNVTIRLADLNNTIVKNFTVTINQLNNISRLLDRLYNHLRISFFNNLTGLGIDPVKFKIYINGTRIFDTEYKTLANNVTVVVKDFFNRVIYNQTVAANMTLDIPVPLGTLGISNNNSFAIFLNITPADSNVTMGILLQPNEFVSLELLLGEYYIDVYRVVYSENTGQIIDYRKLGTLTVNLNAQSQNLALDYEGPGLAKIDNNILAAIYFSALLAVVGIIVKEFWFVSKKKVLGKEPDEPIIK